MNRFDVLGVPAVWRCLVFVTGVFTGVSASRVAILLAIWRRRKT